jgi:hypothetical protein
VVNDDWCVISGDEWTLFNALSPIGGISRPWQGEYRFYCVRFRAFHTADCMIFDKFKIDGGMT